MTPYTLIWRMNLKTLRFENWYSIILFHVSEPHCNVWGHLCAFVSKVPNRRNNFLQNSEEEEGVQSIIITPDYQWTRDAAKPTLTSLTLHLWSVSLRHTHIESHEKVYELLPCDSALVEDRVPIPPNEDQSNNNLRAWSTNCSYFGSRDGGRMADFFFAKRNGRCHEPFPFFTNLFKSNDASQW